MKLFERALLALVDKAVIKVIDYSIAREKAKKLKEEKKLAKKLADILYIDKDKVALVLKTYEDGSSVVKVEIALGISQKQLTQAEEFMDKSTAVRQNVRRPTPAVN